MQPIITPLSFTYKKPGEEVWVLNFNDIPVEKQRINDQQIVYLAPQSIGGNHQHPRTEWFVGIGELVFHWLDEQGVKHEVEMRQGNQLQLIEVPPLLPHAVTNRSKTESGVLFEMADGIQREVEYVQVT